MNEAELEREVRYIDALPSFQRREYLNEVEKARGLEVLLKLKAALIALWQAGR